MRLCKRGAATAVILTVGGLVLASCASQTPETASPNGPVPTGQGGVQTTQPTGANNPDNLTSANSAEGIGGVGVDDNGPGTEANPLVFAFIPSRGLGDAEANASQFASHLSSTTGLVVQAYVAQSNAEVVEALCSGQAHMAVLNTAYITARERGCADAAVAAMRNGLPITTGQIITRTDSGITQIGDLAGHTFCRDSRTSASGWIVPALLMRANGINPDTDLGEIRDTGSPVEVVRAIYEGSCDAGATYVDAREGLLADLPDLMDKTLVAATTGPIPNEIIAFHPSVPDEVRQQVVDTLLAITEDQAGTQLLAALYGWDSLIEIDDTLFDVFDPLLASPSVEPGDFLGD